MAEKNKARESVNNADSENMKAKTSGIQNTSEGAASEKGRAEAPKKGSAAAPKKSSKAVQPSNKQKTLDAAHAIDPFYQPIQIVEPPPFNLTKLTDDELEAFERLCRKVLPDASVSQMLGEEEP